jgi:DNA-directed RNA polymerase subunit RPC12/RpoP
MSEVAAIQPQAQPTACAETKTEPIVEEQKYKCHTCHHIIWESELIGDKKTCPECGEQFTHLQKMCRLDHCHCHHEVIVGIAHCPECGAPICPECGCHDVVQISRVTGYLQDVSGWNAGKQQELKDRKRVSTSEISTY